MPDQTTLPVGKLPLDLLVRKLAPLTPGDPRVLVVSSDPITFATDEIGRYAVAVNANDVAVRGATPRWFLVTVLLPSGVRTEALQRLMSDLTAACRDLAIDVVGGHTEVTGGLDRPIIAGTMLGEVARERLVTTGGARVGDVLLLGGTLAVEGTAVLAREAVEALTARG